MPFIIIMLIWLVIVIVYPTLSLGPAGAMNGDAALREQRRAVIPGGLWSHMRVQGLPAGYPQFFQRADGCRLWDADGREFIDFMCSWGPIVLGHHDAEVEAAAEARRRARDTMNGPAPVLVELAETFTAIVAHADSALFANGTDATTICVTTAPRPPPPSTSCSWRRGCLPRARAVALARRSRRDRAPTRYACSTATAWPPGAQPPTAVATCWRAGLAFRRGSASPSLPTPSSRRPFMRCPTAAAPR